MRTGNMGQPLSRGKQLRSAKQALPVYCACLHAISLRPEKI